MDKLSLFGFHDLARITNHRSGEVKFGEKMLTVPAGSDPADFIRSCDAPFVLFGIPEDIGVRANGGKPGAHSAWEQAAQSIANIQHNRFCKGSSILILGHIDVRSEMEEAANLDLTDTDSRKALFPLVERIDREVSHLVSVIVSAGKIPIIIGGGHNNSYGNIKGTALAKGRQINAINFDAHSDFRILEGRHSGNGFSYAYEEDFLKRYFIFGLHESYTSKSVLNVLKKTEDRVRFNTYDEIAVRGQKDFDSELSKAYEFIKGECFGIEIDLDAIPGMASSAMTPSGFTVESLRRFTTFFGRSSKAAYLHICEGAPELAGVNGHLIGKLAGYLVTDFIKANLAQSQLQPEKAALRNNSK